MGGDYISAKIQEALQKCRQLLNRKINRSNLGGD